MLANNTIRGSAATVLDLNSDERQSDAREQLDQRRASRRRLRISTRRAARTPSTTTRSGRRRARRSSNFNGTAHTLAAYRALRARARATSPRPAARLRPRSRLPPPRSSTPARPASPASSYTAAATGTVRTTAELAPNIGAVESSAPRRPAAARAAAGGHSLPPTDVARGSHHADIGHARLDRRRRPAGRLATQSRRTARRRVTPTTRGERPISGLTCGTTLDLRTSRSVGPMQLHSAASSPATAVPPTHGPVGADHRSDERARPCPRDGHDGSRPTSGSPTGFSIDGGLSARSTEPMRRAVRRDGQGLDAHGCRSGIKNGHRSRGRLASQRCCSRHGRRALHLRVLTSCRTRSSHSAAVSGASRRQRPGNIAWMTVTKRTVIARSVR